LEVIAATGASKTRSEEKKGGRLSHGKGGSVLGVTGEFEKKKGDTGERLLDQKEVSAGEEK